MLLSQGIEFKTDSGKSFVYCTDGVPAADEVFFSPDGRVYYALDVRVHGTADRHDLAFTSAVRRVAGSLRRAGDTIHFALERYERTGAAPNVRSLVRIPRSRRVSA